MITVTGEQVDAGGSWAWQVEAGREWKALQRCRGPAKCDFGWEEGQSWSCLEVWKQADHTAAGRNSSVKLDLQWEGGRVCRITSFQTSQVWFRGADDVQTSRREIINILLSSCLYFPAAAAVCFSKLLWDVGRGGSMCVYVCAGLFWSQISEYLELLQVGLTDPRPNITHPTVNRLEKKSLKVALFCWFLQLFSDHT